MIDAIAAFEGRMAKVEGGVATGKTEALIRRCARSISQGEDPASIGVCVASGMAADEFRERLRHALGDKEALADKVRIARALDFCTEILSTPEARDFTGRTPRLLDASEYAFFLEDMKTLGTPVRRMRKMLSFFYRQWANLNPESEWLEPGEESQSRKHMSHLLESYGAMIEQEAPMLCAQYLTSEEGKQARHAYMTMLCDDFQNLSHAEQSCMCMLARNQVIVCGNVNQTSSNTNTYPHPEGFADFAKLRHGVQEFFLDSTPSNPEIAAMTNALCSCDGMDSRMVSTAHAENSNDNAAEIVKWGTPNDEINGLAYYVADLCKEGGDEFKRRLVLFVPNRRWAHALHDALSHRGIASSLAAAGSRIGGDPRDLKRCEALTVFLRLGLLARPHDVVTWRCWCGLDNYLTNSDAWTRLDAWAQEQNLGLYEALERASKEVAAGREPFLRAEVLTQRFDEGRAFIEANAKRRGFALARVTGAQDAPEFADIVDLMDGDEDAVQLEALARAFFADPKPRENAYQVRIVSFDKAEGLSCDIAIIAGAIDGFIPVRNAFELIQTDEERERTMREQRRLFYSVVGKAKQKLMVSYSAQADLELAERTKMQVVRVRSEEGKRVAMLRPSSFLEEMGDARPGAIGGQALLCQRGLN